MDDSQQPHVIQLTVYPLEEKDRYIFVSKRVWYGKNKKETGPFCGAG